MIQLFRGRFDYKIIIMIFEGVGKYTRNDEEHKMEMLR